jgi:hypothetical protein
VVIVMVTVKYHVIHVVDLVLEGVDGDEECSDCDDR